MRDIYRDRSIGGGYSRYPTLNLKGVECANPLHEFLQKEKWYGAFLFGGLPADDNYLIDIYIMPVKESDSLYFKALKADPKPINQTDVLVPGFFRVIKYCNVSLQCER